MAPPVVRVLVRNWKMTTRQLPQEGIPKQEVLESMSEKFRVGFIGCGGIAGRHFKDVDSDGRAEVVAMCDPDPQRISGWKEKRAELSKALEYADYKEMLGADNLDVVYINSPHKFHFDQIMDSLRAGCHVVTEKPMVCSIEDARTVCQASKELDKAVVVAYQRRYQAPYRKMREIVDSGELGSLLGVTAYQLQGWLVGTKGTWRQNMELSCGGQLNDSGSHIIDILLFMINDVPLEVFSFLDNRGTEVDIDSTVCARFRKGTLLSLLIGGSAAHFLEEITFVFEKGTAVIKGGTLLVHSGRPMEVKEAELVPFSSTPTKNILDHLEEGAEILVGPVAGLRVMQLTEPAWKAAETGLPQTVEM